jgi:hypothetical protein
VLFLHNTSRVEDEPYPTLLQDKGFRGFPSICFMDAEGNVLAKPGRSVKAFQETLVATKKLVDLRNKGDKRSAAETKELFLAELKLDLIPAGELQQRADAVPGLSKADKDLVAQKIVDAEVQAVMQEAREAGPEATGEKLVAIARSGREPSEAVSGIFWQQVLRHASGAKDAALAEKAHAALLKRFADEKGAQFERARKNWDEQLEAAKKK